jgi:hypothetical protein
LGGLVAGNVASFASVTVNGKLAFTGPANATWHALPTARAPKPATYAGAVWHALLGQPYGAGIAAALVAAAATPGAVPAKYSTSYALVAAWLAGAGPQPGASHMVNCASHLRGYLQGYMLKPQHGGLVLR